MKELLSLHGTLGDKANVVGFRGVEAMSSPYRFDIYVTLDASDEDLAEAVGTRASLTFDRGDDRPPYTLHGVLDELDVIHELQGRVLVGVALIPQFAVLLGKSMHSRIFTNMAVPEVLQHVLDDAGMTSDEYKLRLVNKYRPEEHICQYQESDLAFVSRWMEREGLYYFFEHDDDREVLIISDNVAFARPLLERPVRFHPVTSADVSAGEALRTFKCKVRQLPAKVRIDDYDYIKPSLDVTGQARVSRAGVGEVRVHGARVFSPDDSKRLSVLRAEELLARQRVYRASGNASHLRSGHTFKLQDHPRSDGEYLCTRLEHESVNRATTAELRQMTDLESDEVYRVEVTAIPKSVQFRPESTTPWPRVYGVERGVIDGETDSEYAQIDEHGRYKVLFPFDELDAGRGKASTWVRMMQPHGGGTEGWHFPLRKGTEVLVAFLGGDPDRPVIAGVAPNAHKPSPITHSNHTTNIIQTGGRNRIEIEDKKGHERVTISSPYANSMIRFGAPNKDHNMIIKTDGATRLDAGKDWDVTVGVDLNEKVEGQVTEEYLGQKTTVHKIREEVYAKQDTQVKDLCNQHYSVHSLTVDNDATESVGGNVTQTVGGNIDVWSTGGSITLKANNAIHLDAPSWFKVSTPSWLKLTKASVEIYGFKNAAGLEKFDAAAISLAANGMKLDASGRAFSMSGQKFEQTGSSVSTYGSTLSNAVTKIDIFGMKYQQGATRNEVFASHISSGGFLNMLKAFVKIG